MATVPAGKTGVGSALDGTLQQAGTALVVGPPAGVVNW